MKVIEMLAPGRAGRAGSGRQPARRRVGLLLGASPLVTMGLFLFRCLITVTAYNERFVAQL